MKNTVYTPLEKIDAEEIAKILTKLPEKEVEKIYYITKGAALVSEKTVMQKPSV